MDLGLISKKTAIIFGLIAVLELLSGLAYIWPALQPVFFLLTIALVVALSLVNLSFGLLICLAELAIGGKGYLLYLPLPDFRLSLRLGIFLALLGDWLFIQIRQKRWNIFRPIGQLKFNSQSIIYTLGLAALFIGISQGIFRNQTNNVFFDFNAWLFFALIPVFYQLAKDADFLKKFLTVLAAATAWLSLKTLALLIIFSHGLVIIRGDHYFWIRDTGVGEITHVSGTIFRIFLQSQLYCLFALMIFFALTFNRQKRSAKIMLWVLVYLNCLSLLISQSRSFWVGAAGALIICLPILIFLLKEQLKIIILNYCLFAIIIISQLFLINIITGNFSGNLLEDRFNNLDNEPAGISRLNQLKPLSQEIIKAPIFGFGFGKTITYQSQDPRILKNNPSGNYTTYAFEWGYLDIVLKLGMFGLAVYLILIIKIFYQAFKKISILDEWGNLYFGLILALLALLITNIFSPYLNHPLGIGFILLLLAILSVKKTATSGLN